MASDAYASNLTMAEVHSVQNRFHRQEGKFRRAAVMRKPDAAHSGRPRFVTGMAPPRRRREDIGDAIGEGAGDGALRQLVGVADKIVVRTETAKYIH